MKKPFIIAGAMAILSAGALVLLSFRSAPKPCCAGHTLNAPPPKGCVFKTVYEGEGLDPAFIVKTSAEVRGSEDRGLTWLLKAQLDNGGFGAGTHAHQEVMDPHAVQADPATTAMVGMALLRMGSTMDEGTYATQVKKATLFLLDCVERSPKESFNVTELQGTQIQVKLGANIDVALTAQFFSNLLQRTSAQHALHKRLMDDLNVCVAKIQRAQNGDGSVNGAGWAGVLQSSFAASALESAEHNGAEVDKKALQKAQEYQKGNFDANTGTVATDAAAGVTLYAISSSTRSSAKEARKAEEDLAKAREKGLVDKEAPMSAENLEQAGYTKDEAERMNTSYQVYKTAKAKAQSNEVISGFGNNGGEEFLSFLQTGESLIINKDMSWKNWYESTTACLVGIQNNDGSWNGHHCITSPVFCTATSLLILSVNNDIEALVAQGATGKN
jgi:hypothetical protein